MSESKKDLLGYKKTNFYEVATPEQIQAAYDYCVDYAKYLDASKTEREAVATSIAMAEAQGGDGNVLRDVSLFEEAKCSYEVVAKEDGVIQAMDTENVLIVPELLRAGEKTKA